MLIAIAAVAKRHVIGHEGKMPWSLPAEYEHFLNSVNGHALIMGRRSFEEFGKDLMHTKNIVLSRGQQKYPNAQTAPSIEAALDLARNDDRVFCAGGAEVYEQMVPQCDELWISYIDQEVPGDRFFPPIDPQSWQVKRQSEQPGYRYVEYWRTVRSHRAL